MSRPFHHPAARERGQAAVEAALVLPLMIFTLLGILQVTVAYHARLVTQLAAFKAARAASLFRGDCEAMKSAALSALIPSMATVGSGMDTRTRYAETAKRVMASNRPISQTGRAANVPVVSIDWIYSSPRPRFDELLEPNEVPMKVHVRLVHFFEYRIPFANWILTRTWLATQTGVPWATGADPLTPVKQAGSTPYRPTPGLNAHIVSIARRAIDERYFTTPIVASWTARMMSDPYPGEASSIFRRCE